MISIIIPAYNEAENIKKGCLYPVIDWAIRHRAELLVINDGSTDETEELLKRYVNYVTLDHSGKAGAIINGILLSKGDELLIMDLDQATPIDQAPQLLDQLDHLNGPQIVIGSRGLSRPGAPLARYILSYGMFALRWLFTGLPFVDTQCGFKAMSRAAALDVLDHLVLYDHVKPSSTANVSPGFDVEFLYVARLLNYLVIDTPVEWRYRGSKRVHFLRDARRGVMALIGIGAARLMGYYPKPVNQGRRIPWGTIIAFLVLVIISYLAVKP